jgi:hypothetical protein
MEVPKKIIQIPSVMKRGKATITKKDNASNKRSRKENTRPLQKTVNVDQPVVDRHLVDINMTQSNTQVRYINGNASTSENPDTLILGNCEESNGIEEISINYTSSGEVYDRSTTIVNSSFSTIIAESVLANPDPKTMAEFKKYSDWNKWNEAIDVELSSLKKRKVFTDVISTPSRIFPVGFRWVFV